MNLFVWSSGQFIVKGIAVAYMYVCMYVADFRGGKESHCPPKVMLICSSYTSTYMDVVNEVVSCISFKVF